MIVKKIKANTTKFVFGIAMMFCIMGAAQANESLNEDSLVSVRTSQVVAVEKSGEDVVKKATLIENLKKAGGVVAKNTDALKKMGVEAVEDFKSGKAKYDDLCAKHIGDLNWYHKIKYGFLAYVVPAAKIIYGVVKDIVLPLVQAFA